MKQAIKWILKIPTLPLFVLAWIFKWIGTFLLHCSAWIFRILAAILFVTAVLGHFMGLEETAATITMLATAFIIFMVPYIAGWIVSVFDAAAMVLLHFIAS